MQHGKLLSGKETDLVTRADLMRTSRTLSS
jgi:hypothetical protein